MAIRDLDQQMYVSIKNTGKKYQVVGTYHYSLSSECALFKVIASYVGTGMNFLLVILASRIGQQCSCLFKNNILTFFR